MTTAVPLRSGRYPVAARVIAMAASAGGLKALSSVLGALPTGFPAAILVMTHLDPRRPSHLAEILSRRTALRVRQAGPADRLATGTVFVAPPGAHLLVDRSGSLFLSQRPPLHFVRPSADRLFESLAYSFGPRAVAVVLTGMGSDGAEGAAKVKRLGGVVLVQDQATSEFFGMPHAAIGVGLIDHVLPLHQIAEALVELAGPGGEG